jgi:hypothetical protein
MTCPNRFPKTLAFAALAIFLLPPLHAQTATSKDKPSTHSGNTQGNHKDIMSTAAAPSASGNGGASQQEVRTEKINVKQDPTGSVVSSGDDNDPQKHHGPPATLASSGDYMQKKHVANVTAAPGDDNNPIKHVPTGGSASSITGTSTSTTPQAAQDNTKFKQEFGPTVANKKN